MAKDLYTKVPAGQVLFREGENGAAMYILESGSVELSRGGRSLSLLDAGDVCGEMAVLDDQPHFATATAKTEVRVLRIERATFADLLRANGDIAVRILRQVATRQRRAEQRLLEVQGEAAAAKAAGVPAAGPADKAVPAPPAAQKAATGETAAKAQRVDSPQALPAAPPAAAAAAATTERAAPAAAGGVSPAAVAPPLSLRHGVSGQQFRLGPERTEFLVGRPDPATGTTPDINLGPLDVGRSLSRRHAKLVRVGDGLVLREETATANGTFVNGQRLVTGVDSPLKPGDRVRFGAVELEVVAE